MRRCLTTLLAGAALFGVAPAAFADVVTATATTNRGRSCTVRLEAYAVGGTTNRYLPVTGSDNCGADPLYGQPMGILWLRLSMSGVSASTASTRKEAVCRQVNYCGTGVTYSGILPGVPYTVTGNFTLDAADYPFDTPERWPGHPPECVVQGGDTLACELTLTYTPPLAAPVL
jgi:hypothetical protein